MAGEFGSSSKRSIPKRISNASESSLLSSSSDEQADREKSAVSIEKSSTFGKRTSAISTKSNNKNSMSSKSRGSLSLPGYSSAEDLSGSDTFAKRRSFLTEDDKEEELRQRISARFGHIKSLGDETKEESATVSGPLTVRGIVHRLRLARLQIEAATLHLKLQIWLVLEEPFGNTTSSVLSYAMLVVIVASTLHAMIFSEPSSLRSELGFWEGLDLSFNLLFTAEILLRLWSFPNWNRFFLHLSNITDVCVVLPFWLNDVFEMHESIGEGWAVLNTFEAFLRMLKLCRYFSGWSLLFHALKGASSALVLPLFFLVILALGWSSILLAFEVFHEDATILRLVDALHYSIICIVSITVGEVYEMAPVSVGGKAVACCCMILGVMFLAMPITIIGSTFSQTWFQRDRILLLNKVRERLAQRGFHENDLREVFQEVDEDGSGKIEFQEFRRMTDTFHLGLNLAKERRLFGLFADVDGAISYDDFACALYPHLADELLANDQEEEVGEEEEEDEEEELSKESSQLSEIDENDSSSGHGDGGCHEKDDTSGPGEPSPPKKFSLTLFSQPSPSQPRCSLQSLSEVGPALNDDHVQQGKAEVPEENARKKMTKSRSLVGKDLDSSKPSTLNAPSGVSKKGIIKADISIESIVQMVESLVPSHQRLEQLLIQQGRAMDRGGLGSQIPTPATVSLVAKGHGAKKVSLSNQTMFGKIQSEKQTETPISKRRFSLAPGLGSGLPK